MNNDIVFSFEDARIKRIASNFSLEHVHFTLRKNEHWALVGKSGSGKTTLLEAIAGKNTIIQGTVVRNFYKNFIKNHPDISPLFTWRHLVGFVSPKQDFVNLSNVTDFYYQQRYHAAYSDDAPDVYDYLQSKPVDNPSNIWTIETVIDSLRLDHLRHTSIIKLSNGETRRLLIAEQLLRNPRLLLLDNPFMGLDKESRYDLSRLIAMIAASGIQIIAAVLPSEVPSIMTHTAILNDGRIEKKIEKKDFHLDMRFADETPAEKRNANDIRALLPPSPRPKYRHIIKMNGASVRYDDKIILDHIDWSVRQGDKWALSGSNGSGKSTLLSLVNGDHPQAYANDIVLFDKKRGGGESIWEIKRKIGFVSAELFRYFSSAATCVEAIRLGLQDSSYAKDTYQNIAEKIMEAAQIEKYKDLPLRQAPIGIQRLCFLFRALIKNPPLLILDEPCQGMDAEQIEKFRAIIDHLYQNDATTTIIYVSHYEKELPFCIDKRLRLEAGKVVFRSL